MSQISLIALNGKLGFTTNMYNVVEEYCWTLTPAAQRKNLKDQIPYITLTEYEQDLANMYAQLNYFYTQGSKTFEAGKFLTLAGTTENPYDKLYSAKPTGTMFKLPYFEGYDHNISQTWADNQGLLKYKAVETLVGIVQNLALATQTAPGVNLNKPKIWSGGGNMVSYPIKFTLFNTAGTKTDDQIVKRNQELKRRLQMSTLHDQRTSILTSPPALFEVNIPGIRRCPVAVISNLTISNVGQMNIIGTDIIPDAYEFTITIQELVTESRQILAGSMGGSVVQAIDTSNQLSSENIIG